MKEDFERVWGRIIGHAGKNFNTKTKIVFTYRMDGDGIVTSRTDYRLGRSDFRKAYELVPIERPGMISDLVRGSAYIWAILHDERIIPK